MEKKSKIGVIVNALRDRFQVKPDGQKVKLNDLIRAIGASIEIIYDGKGIRTNIDEDKLIEVFGKLKHIGGQDADKKDISDFIQSINNEIAQSSSKGISSAYLDLFTLPTYTKTIELQNGVLNENNAQALVNTLKKSNYGNPVVMASVLMEGGGAGHGFNLSILDGFNPKTMEIGETSNIGLSNYGSGGGAYIGLRRTKVGFQLVRYTPPSPEIHPLAGDQKIRVINIEDRNFKVNPDT
jgi:hypothetical protein